MQNRDIFHSDYIYLSTINAALGACFFGYVNSVFNPLQSYLQSTIYPGISQNLLYLMISIVPAGAGVGAVVAGSLALKFGRRQTLILTDIISIFAIALTLMRNEYFLLFGRLASGFCVGLNSSIVPLYISEASPMEFKGVTGTFTQIGVSVGILIAYILGLNVPAVTDKSESEWWRVMLGFPLILAALRICLLTTKFDHETPKYLVLTGNEEEARNVLEKMYRKEHVSEQLVLIRKERQNESQAGKIGYSELFSIRYRKRLRVACFIAILQQFSGINAIIFYSSLIFSQSDSDPNSKMPQVYTMIVGILNLASAFFATLLINRMGRKTLLLSGTGILFNSLLLLPICNYLFTGSAAMLSKLFIFIYILGFGFSLGSITWIYISEILPDIGVGIAVLLSWVSCVVIAQCFPYMIDWIGLNGAFLFFAVCCFSGIILILRWVKETKGRMPHEIVGIFQEESGERDIEIVNLVHDRPENTDI